MKLFEKDSQVHIFRFTMYDPKVFTTFESEVVDITSNTLDGPVYLFIPLLVLRSYFYRTIHLHPFDIRSFRKVSDID